LGVWAASTSAHLSLASGGRFVGITLQPNTSPKQV
jgi:hypothetical protein